jgi:tripartite ATP-independent transporter DctM subunit
MLRYGYCKKLSCGVITASGTLGQIIPPSIVLVILGDVMSNANQKAQLAQGNFSPQTVSVGDLFFGALIPGLVLVGLYICYVAAVAFFQPKRAPSMRDFDGGDKEGISLEEIFKVLLPPILLIVCVLGSILAGAATPTEAAAVGGLGAAVLALANRRLNISGLQTVMQRTTRITCMVFVILIGANIFSLVFRGFGGDETVSRVLAELPGGAFGAFIAVMALMFVLGFFLDFIEIVFVVVPIVAPILLQLGMDPVWLGVMIALNLQTSFLTPPFGFALFYLRGVAPPVIATADIYRGAVPFIAIQTLLLAALWFFPQAAVWLPKQIYGG